MNKNQKAIRKLAAKNNGETYQVQGTNIIKRSIPPGIQPRISKAPKVAASAKSISQKVNNSGSAEN